ncbi:MAG: TonB-dependent receptor [Acidobacteria bacterium]|nr:TonB-dependent receptor [Acidobacteriota bacterium]
MKLRQSIKQAMRIASPLALLLAVLMMPQKAEAQVLYGSIVGNVKDSTGAVVPQVAVTVTNKENNLTRQATTGVAGGYSFTDLQTGTYSLKISHQGFKTFEQTEVPVTLNNVTRVDITLELGKVTETVTVSGGAAATLQTDTAEVRTGLVAKELENLPVPLGRNYQHLLRVLPGFSVPVDGFSIGTNPTRALEFNVNGTTNSQNNTRVDGISTYNVFGPSNVAYIPSLESIEEVNVVTSNFSAEQGFAGGAAINLQTKSGTNQLHGSLFEYHSNNHLKAWPMLFDAVALNTGTKPKLIYNEFGGAVGGPIKKDKAFYFVSYQGTYENRAVQRTVGVATPAMKRGDFSASASPIYDPLTGNPDGSGRRQFSVSPGDPNYSLCNTATNPQCLNILPAARLDSIARKIAALIPNPNLATTSSSNYFASGPFSFHRDQIDSKVNWNVTPKLNLAGTFGVLHYDARIPAVFGDALVGRAIGGTNFPGSGSGNTYRFTVLGTYAFSPNFFMDAHVGWARLGTDVEQTGIGTNIGREVLGIPGTNGTRRFESGWPMFTFSGFDTLGTPRDFLPFSRRHPQHQFVANFNWTKGTHDIRFGTDIYRMALNEQQAESPIGGPGGQGGFFFGRGVTQRCERVNPDGTCAAVSGNSPSNSFAAFMLGLPTERGRTLQVPDLFQMRAWLYSFYGRDRWNITPKLTLDLGLRWEYLPLPFRPDRGIERYDPERNKALVCGIGSVPRDCGTEISKKLFSPRVGLAYRATDSLVVRAGYGITSNAFQPFNGSRANYPILIGLLQSNLAGSLFPVGTLAAGIPLIKQPDLGNGVIDIPSDIGFAGLPKKLERGYIQSWNLTLQKELKYGFVGQAGYVATRQTRMLTEYIDINAGQVIGAGDSGRTLFPRFGRVATTFELRPVGTGQYNSLQASLQRRFSQGLGLTVNYTWGKAINVISNSDSTPAIQALRHFHLNRSVTGFDRTHNLAVIKIWELPFGKGRRWLSNRGVASAILGGWQVNTLLSLISGTPFTVNADDTSLNLPGSSQQADQVKPQVRKLGGIGVGTPFYDPSAFAEVPEARFGTSGLNVLRGPGIVNWDFGLFREFSFSERFKLQFRAEAFNFTNTPHFGNPSSFCCDPDFMVISSTSNPAREGIDERQFRFGLRISF